VYVHLRCIAINLKKTGKNRQNIAPPWKNFCGRPCHCTQFFLWPRGMHCLAAESRLSQKSCYALSIFDVSRGGNLSADSSVRRQKRFQSALRKLQRFTGPLWAGTLSFGGIVREGRCCNRGNFPWTRLSGSRLSWPKLAKARSGLVPTFHRLEKKLTVSFGLYNRPRLLDVAQASRLSPSDVLL